MKEKTSFLLHEVSASRTRTNGARGETTTTRGSPKRQRKEKAYAQPRPFPGARPWTLVFLLFFLIAHGSLTRWPPPKLRQETRIVSSARFEVGEKSHRRETKGQLGLCASPSPTDRLVYASANVPSFAINSFCSERKQRANAAGRGRLIILVLKAIANV